ncbi:hypothetical protein BJV78DRAFT_1261862 [Lactifluus subvellereus]|nr:hypothetical protein BJV78DRAFT_1261862 [Lactifluus subvellereus]
MLMGVAGRSTLVFTIRKGTCIRAGQRGSGCDPYNCCCCPPSRSILEGRWAVNVLNMEHSATSSSRGGI